MKLRLTVTLFLLQLFTLQILHASPPDSTLYAGFRGSRIRPYSAQYWQWVGDSMSHNFTRAATPAGVWIVSFYVSNGNISVQFPSGGNSYPYMSFASTARS